MGVNRTGNWRKSSYSTGVNSMCAEVAPTIGGFAVRDSKDPFGPALCVNTGEWRLFLDAVQHDGVKLIQSLTAAPEPAGRPLGGNQSARFE